ncbi:HD domain-containing protein [Microscilla marina]|uniref:Metal-dependent phosphohydrolase n=1 Tax=Microscilla marina ATCC 23134 TaxID=313606 RepID=A1ZD39_MICM2|nr:HD domain-containing protein [Microscilla marina]EAY31578.1 metal-dependent phosphohydrolase [Microscilla marina ATCC 23134]
MSDKMIDMPALFKALEFSAFKHKDQRRKGPQNIPYINHPIQVAHVLIETGQAYNTNLLIAAILHDTIEDTDTTEEEIKQVFGENVAALVMEVTDDKNLFWEARKQLQIEKSPFASYDAKLLKLADKICNVRDLVINPPDKWSLDRKLEYLQWASDVIAGIRGVNQPMEDLFDEWIYKAKAYYKMS